MSLKLKASLLRSTLFISAASFASAAAAQVDTSAGGATAQAPDAVTGEIVVTGSRIASPNLEQSSPVAVVTSEELALRAPSSVEQILRQLPGTVAGINPGVNNGNNGTATFNLRGLGTNRNLVLLNGRRVVPSTLGNVVDLNVIPLGVIERADVLTGGAVTTYGADAIAGLVNFVIRRDFEGVELTGQYGITERGDGSNYRIDFTGGTNFAEGKGNVVLSVSYTKTNPVFQGDRSYGQIARQSTCAASQLVNGICPATVTIGNRQGSATAVPATLFFPLPASSVDPRFGAAGGGRFDPATGTIVPGLSDYNFNPLNYYLTPLDRWSAYSAAHYEIAPAVEAYAEFLYTRSRVNTSLAPTGTFNNQFQIPLNNRFLTPTQATQLCTFAGLANCPAAIAAGTPITAIVARRFTETGPRLASLNTDLFQVTAGLRGKLTETLNWEIFGQYGEANRRNTNTGTALASRVQQSLNGCPTGSAAGCVPINIFGAEGTVTPEALAFVGVPTNTFINTKFSSVQGFINGDFGVSSPFSDEPIGIAIGGEYRKYSGGQFGDLPNQIPGEILGSGGVFSTVNGSFYSKEFYGELNAPLVTDRPFFHNLTLEAGIRYADYSNSGGNWTYKVGGSWSIVPEIKMRGAWTRAVRAPNIGELFTPVAVGLANIATDPCQLALPLSNPTTTALCTAQLAAVGLPASRLGSIPQPPAGQINITSGGNQDLRPEKATTITFGVVFTPQSMIPGFSATMDFYSIRVRGAIGSPTVSDILNGCFSPGQTSPNDVRCQLIRRNPLTGGLFGSPADTGGVVLQTSNFGFIDTRGIDVTLSYTRKFGDIRFNGFFAGNYTPRSRTQATPSSIIRECAGFYSVSCDPAFPRWTWNARTTLGWGPVDVSLFWRHIGRVRYEPRTLGGSGPAFAGQVGSFGPVNPVTLVPNYARIKPFNFFDLNIGVDVTKAVNLSFLVENLFDKAPPFVGNTATGVAFNNGNTFPSLYDAIGRRFTVQARAKF